MRFQTGVNLAILSALSVVPVAECTVDTALKIVSSVGEVAAAAHAIKQIWAREVTAEGDFALTAELETVTPEISLEGRAKPCISVPAGVPSNVVENCCAALSGKYLYISGWKSTKKIRVTGIPYACISAAPWFDGTGVVPYACGDSCLEWAGLSSADFTAVANAFSF
ncbi:uncharacterized protein CTRU02_210472 [Colletotrichum truncatum]|uniref:Uncharacterized protein n=1 Tax=Colletotrichum truncatum TaxID=5467 RepID=A0ACC3YP33_COLTU|nr:uncharacterized protein CTRU02_13924 [Colletotrichum truncatum]KAF6782767.1 hypothetical protein CTRU02_13924 [Colletotrichum truncatum]